MTASSAELQERRLQVVAEQAAGLRWQIALTAAIVCAIGWSTVPTAWLATWFTVVVVCRELRASALTRMVQDRVGSIESRIRATVVWNMVLGTANGSAGLFMLWLDPVGDALLTMIIVSWGAGAVSTSATVLPAFIGYAGMVFVPTAAMWAANLSGTGFGVATLVLMFFGVQLRFARKNSETFDESFRMRMENLQLAESLAVERSELARARDVAETANREKSRFLAAASHDLRQPLQAMTFNADALARLPIDEDARSIARDIHSSVEQLRGMLDGLLDVSKLDGGGVVPHFRVVDVNALLTATTESFRATAVAKHLELRWSADRLPHLRTDPDILRRIVANLIDNAIKFTERGAVTVSASVSDLETLIEVADTGIGVAPEDRIRIFEDLVQLGDPHRIPGHGLGLGIVRRLAALLGGKVTVDAAAAGGSCFRVVLPTESAPAATPAQQLTRPRLESLRVLVLDDNPTVRRAYEEALTGMSATVVLSATIAQARVAIQAAPADAAIVDYRLSTEEDGIQAIDQLRAIVPGLPVVLVSADLDSALRIKADQRGVRCLRKPVDTTTLGHEILAAHAAYNDLNTTRLEGSNQ